jgi:sugar phosphate isomerase/epimerase
VRPVWSGASAPTLSLEDDLAAAAAAGYDAVELPLAKLWPHLERRGPDGLVGLLRSRRLAAVALGPITDATFRDAAGAEKLLSEVHGAATVARQVGADWVLVEPGERPDGADERDALREGRSSLERLCRASERYDVGLALVPVGLAWASIRTVGQAIQVIEGVGRKSLGLALDTFHFHIGGSSLDDVRRCRARAFALVRLADAPEGDREGLRDHHRRPPGTGVAPVRALVGVVRALGADPPAVVHVPMPAGEGDAAGWARRLREAALDILRGPELAPSR